MNMRVSLMWSCSTLLAIILTTEAKLKERDCEVCITVLQKVLDAMPDPDRTNQQKIDSKLKQICDDLRGKEHKFCFYIGALMDSATSIMNDVTKPLSYSMPPEKVCEKLKGMDSQICELKYDKAIDWNTVDLNKLRVKELKKILEEWGEQCKACTEKSEFVRRIQELKPQYVKTEL